jgi:hypothetical protein
MVHVISYAVHCGQPVNGLVVAHLCHNPACCNPIHLQLMTQKENVAQQLARGTFCFPPRKRKLSRDAYPLIRMSHAYRNVSALNLAEQYGVSKSLIEKILYSNY